MCCADILVNQCRLRIPERRETSFSFKLTLAGLIWKLYLAKEFESFYAAFDLVDSPVNRSAVCVVVSRQ